MTKQEKPPRSTTQPTTLHPCPSLPLSTSPPPPVPHKRLYDDGGSSPRLRRGGDIEYKGVLTPPVSTPVTSTLESGSWSGVMGKRRRNYPEKGPVTSDGPQARPLWRRRSEPPPDSPYARGGPRRPPSRAPDAGRETEQSTDPGRTLPRL